MFNIQIIYNQNGITPFLHMFERGWRNNDLVINLIETFNANCNAINKVYFDTFYCVYYKLHSFCSIILCCILERSKRFSFDFGWV